MLALCAAIVVAGWLRGHRFLYMLKVGISLAIAAVPEELSAVATMTLALGMQRMAGMGAQIRRLPAAESLGSTTVICTDKTGTLTRNAMTVSALVSHADGSDAVLGDTSEAALIAVTEKAGLKEVKSANATCREAGVRSVMITGDHQVTATEIAHQLGIDRANGEKPLQIVHASELANLDAAAWQENDAPALKKADIGVAMGRQSLPQGGAHSTAQIVRHHVSATELICKHQETGACYAAICRGERA